MFSSLVVFYLPGDEVSTGGDGKLSSAAWSLGVVQTWLQSLILTPSTCDLLALLLEPQCSRGREVTLMTAVRIDQGSHLGGGGEPPPSSAISFCTFKLQRVRLRHEVKTPGSSKIKHQGSCGLHSGLCRVTESRSPLSLTIWVNHNVQVCFFNPFQYTWESG